MSRQGDIGFVMVLDGTGSIQFMVKQSLIFERCGSPRSTVFDARSTWYILDLYIDFYLIFIYVRIHK